VLSLIPISDANPTRKTPVLTIALIVVNIFAFFFVEPGLGQTPSAEAYFVRRAAIPCQLEDECPTLVPTRAGPVAEPERDLGSLVGAILFSTFLHAGILHIAGNMLFLWIFGNNVEDHLGRLRYLFFYLLGGIAAGMAQILTNLGSCEAGGCSPAVGASGAVAAVMGAYFVLFPRARVNVLVPIFFIFTVVQMTAWAVLGLWVVFQFLTDQPGVAWEAHVGGFVFGVVAILLLGGRPQRPREVAWRAGSY
jgi:membrane associated rhomboid family serine protease